MSFIKRLTRRKSTEPDFHGETLFGADLVTPGENTKAGNQDGFETGSCGRVFSANISESTARLSISPTGTPDGVFGVAPEDLPQDALSRVENRLTVPRCLEYLVTWLSKNNAEAVEGIFRKSGKTSRVRAAKDLLNSGQEMDSAGMSEGLLAIDVACVLKEYLKLLPTPLLSSRKNEIVAAMEHADEVKRNMELRKAILLLPKLHQDIVAYVIAFLNRIADNSEVNKMTSKNLAVCFEPNLFGIVDNITSLSTQQRIALGEERVAQVNAMQVLISSSAFFR
eukprot:m.313010 g.313010  ORF g.313010 m.313010 type:complete len:281 (+) comp20252_c0_seq1:355-1197(+)